MKYSKQLEGVGTMVMMELDRVFRGNGGSLLDVLEVPGTEDEVRKFEERIGMVRVELVAAMMLGEEGREERLRMGLRWLEGVKSRGIVPRGTLRKRTGTKA